MAIEFALVGGATIALLLASMQVGLYFYISASLETATSKALRQVRTGAVSAATMSAAQFRSTVLCPLLPAGMSCNNVITNIQTVTQSAAPGGFYQFVNANASGIVAPSMDNGSTTFCTGSTTSVVYAQVYYAMPVVFSSLLAPVMSTWNGQSVFFVSAFGAFKNEPFQGSAGGC